MKPSGKRTADAVQQEREWHKRLPITKIPRTLLDVAASVPASNLRRALAEAEYRRLVTLDEIHDALRRGHPGSAALRRALAHHQPQLAHTRSQLEEDFLAVCERYALPLPEVNVIVAGLMVDALWREHGVIVELDGHAAHGTPAAAERDRRRELTLRAAGYVVLRYTWWQITRHPELVHWLHQAEDELVGYAPHDELPLPTVAFPERLLPFFVVITPSVGRQGQLRHRWASMDCLYSQADIDTLRTFFAQVHGRQDTFLFHDCICRFEGEHLLVRPLTTVASRLDSIRIVSLTY